MLIVVVALVSIFVVAFVVVFPVIVLLNKAIGSAWLSEGDALKARLSVIGSRFAEDGVRLRKSSISLFAVGVTWLYADLRADAGALYVMQYHQFPFLFGKIGQPTITVVGRAYTGGVVGMRATITEHPRLEADSVLVKCEFRLGGISLRFKSQNPQALLEALHAIYS